MSVCVGGGGVLKGSTLGTWEGEEGGEWVHRDSYKINNSILVRLLIAS